MDFQPLLELLKEVTELSRDFEAALTSAISKEIYRSHQVIVSQGQRENRMWFLKTGMARAYFYDPEGREHTIRFWKSPDLLFSTMGFYPVSSIRYIEVMERSEMLAITYEQLNELDHRFSEIGKLIDHFLKVESGHYLEWLGIAAMPPQKRYEAFRKIYPYVFKKVPLRFIASYLNITRESLSRIISKR